MAEGESHPIKRPGRWYVWARYFFDGIQSAHLGTGVEWPAGGVPLQVTFPDVGIPGGTQQVKVEARLVDPAGNVDQQQILRRTEDFDWGDTYTVTATFERRHKPCPPDQQTTCLWCCEQTEEAHVAQRERP